MPTDDTTVASPRRAASSRRLRDLSWGLGGRLLASFLLLSLVPLFASNGVGFVRSRWIVESLVERYLHAVVDLQARHVAEHIQQQQDYLVAIGAGNRFLQAAAQRDLPMADPTMREAAAPGAVSVYLLRQVEDAGRFDSMTLFTTDGRPVASSAGGTQDFRRVGPGSEPVAVIRGVDPAEPPALRFAAPVTDQVGQTVGYLTASANTAAARTFLEFPRPIPGDIRSLILDRAGRPIFASSPPSDLSYDQPLQTPLLSLPPGSEGHYVNAEGVDVIGTSASMPGSSWIFVAETPSAAALGDLRALRRLSLVLGGVFSLLVLTVAWFLARGIVAPVRELVTATRTVAGGDLSARVPVVGRDEISELTMAFNDMAGELAASEARIRELHAREIARAEQLATVGELASGMAHEIKNPLVGISNGMDLVLRRVGSDPVLEPIATEMSKQLSRIEQAVRGLLAFARPREPEPAPCDLNDVVRRALRLVEPAAQAGGVAVEFHLTEPLPVLDLDAEQIRQAIVNLAVNAVQHSTAGDVVQISTRTADGFAEIEVRDTGVGIGDEVLQQLFKPFFTTRHAGTGLGLSISRGIVERHGGHLAVETALGEGSAFTILLPLTGAEPMTED